MDGFWLIIIGQPPPPGSSPDRVLHRDRVSRRVETVGGVHWCEYFLHHRYIIMEFRCILDSPDNYWGRMTFKIDRTTPTGNFLPVIRSKFYSWYCLRCRRNHRHFTHHNILLSDGRTRLHCNHVTVGSPPSVLHYYPYDPHARATTAPPIIHNARLTQRAPGQGPRLLRFLIVPCHVCRTNHWYAIQSQAWDSRGQPKHFCNAHPLDHPLTVAASYRPHGTVYAVLGDVPAGLEDSESDGSGDDNAADDDDGQPADDNAADDVDHSQPAEDNAADDDRQPANNDHAAKDEDGQPSDDNAADDGRQPAAK